MSSVLSALAYLEEVEAEAYYSSVTRLEELRKRAPKGGGRGCQLRWAKKLVRASEDMRKALAPGITRATAVNVALTKQRYAEERRVAEEVALRAREERIRERNKELASQWLRACPKCEAEVSRSMSWCPKCDSRLSRLPRLYM